MRAHTTWCLMALGAFAATSRPAGAQQLDSSRAQKPSLISVHAITASTRHQVDAVSSSARAVSASLKGVEGVMRDKSGPGFAARYLSGTFPGSTTAPEAGDIEQIDAWLILGTAFALEIGYAGRKFPLGGETRQVHMPRGGFRLEFPVRGTGITLLSRAGYMRMVSAAKKDSLFASAIDGEVAVRYTPIRVPVSVELGFRQENPFHERGANSGVVLRREQFSSLILGVGVAPRRR